MATDNLIKNACTLYCRKSNNPKEFLNPKVVSFLFCFQVLLLIFVLPSFSQESTMGLTERLQKDLEERNTLKEMSDSATGLLQALKKGEKIAPHIDDLIKKQAILVEEENETKRKFREIEKELKTLKGLREDSPIFLRHQEVLSKYSMKVRVLKESLSAIKEASEKKVRREDFEKKVEELLERTEKYRPKEEYRLHSTGQLPWKTKEPKEVLLLGAVSDAPQGGAPPITQTSPSADDLSATIDVQITPEIQALAASLNNHPLAIFRHVYNEYRYTPYYGSMKGSLDTYWEKEGNDYDLASLLIALLRAAGIPARYVKAKVQVPIDRIEKWVGIDDPMAALIYLATADIPLVGYRQGGQIRYAELEHVYVEAYVPYSKLSGNRRGRPGKTLGPHGPESKGISNCSRGGRSVCRDGGRLESHLG
jgi:transglutaminase-like putative cysteine protease